MEDFMLTADQVVVIIAGLLWPFVFQWVKSYPGWQDRWANVLAIGFAYVLAGVVDVGPMVLRGNYLSFGAVVGLIVTHGSIITALSQLIYRQIIQPATTPTTTPK